MKLLGFLFVSATVLASTAQSKTEEYSLSGCMDCFNFVAPSVLGAESVDPAQAGLIVYDTDADAFRGYNTSGGWSTLSKEAVVQTVTSAVTLPALTDTAFVNGASAAFTVTLPPAAGIAGKIFTIKKVDSSVNLVTIDANSTETIDGTLTKVLMAENEWIAVTSDGANWKMIGYGGNASVITIDSSFGSMPGSAGGWGDGVSIVLQPGEWDISMHTGFFNNGVTTTTILYAGVSATSGSTFPDSIEGENFLRLAPHSSGSSVRHNLGLADIRVTPTSQTTYYLKLRGDTSLTNLQWLGTLRARRIKP